MFVHLIFGLLFYLLSGVCPCSPSSSSFTEMLAGIKTQDGKTVYFGYDALGRRVSKSVEGTVRRYGWDGNVLLHEWDISEADRPRIVTDDMGREEYNGTEKPENLVTWVYDGTSFTPEAKVTEQERYTIVHDYLGTPTQAYDSKGELVWEMLLDVYGEVKECNGDRTLIPFRYQGQYEDEETGLYYNRFRYYSPHMGMYISQDPIGLAGNNPTLYGYVFDHNTEVDPFGLDCLPVKNKTKSPTNGLYYESSTKHTKGQLGHRANAGIEPRNSMDLFNSSIPSSINPKHRFAYDEQSKTLHRFSDGNNGVWHWSGGTNQGPNSLKGNQVPRDIREAFNLPKKGW